MHISDELTFVEAGDHGNCCISPEGDSGVYFTLIGCGSDEEQNAIAAEICAAVNQQRRAESAEVVAKPLDWGNLLAGYQRICLEHGIEPTSADVLAAMKRHDAGEPVRPPRPFCYTASLNLGPNPTIASYCQETIYTVPLYLSPPPASPLVSEDEVEKVAKAICRLVPLEGSSAWIEPYGHKFPDEYSPKEQASIRAIARAALSVKEA